MFSSCTAGIAVALASTLLFGGTLVWASHGPLPAEGKAGHQAAPLARPSSLTFYHDIAPLLAASCAPCHSPGQVGPFPLRSYQDVKRRARQIALVTQSRYMPPWLPDSRSGPFLHDRRLTPSQIAMVQQWVSQGAPAGKSGPLPPPPRLAAGWHLGVPDRVLTLSQPYRVAGDTTEIYRCFVIPMSLSQDRWLRALDFRPGIAPVVRSASVFLDTTGTARRLQAQSGAFGYAAFAAGLGKDAVRLGDWSPDSAPLVWPKGAAIPLPKSADLVLMLRFHPDGQQESEQSQIGLYFAGTPAVTPVTITLGAIQLILRPQQKAVVTDSFTLPASVRLVGLSPHAHAVCRTMEAVAELPDGKIRPLLRIADWQAGWQEPYRFVTPLRLPAGTRLLFQCTLDNSSANPRNPADPPMTIVPGLEDLDRMAVVQIQALPESPAEEVIWRHAWQNRPLALHIDATAPTEHG